MFIALKYSFIKNNTTEQNLIKYQLLNIFERRTTSSRSISSS